MSDDDLRFGGACEPREFVEARRRSTGAAPLVRASGAVVLQARGGLHMLVGLR